MNGLSGFAAALLLAAGVAAAVSAGTIRFSSGKPPGIASVRLSTLTTEYVTRSLRAGGGSEKALAAAREWGARLERALASVAARRGVVLLSAGAVAAGAEDLTGEVESVMAELASRKHSSNKKENVK